MASKDANRVLALVHLEQAIPSPSVHFLDGFFKPDFSSKERAVERTGVVGFCNVSHIQSPTRGRFFLVSNELWTETKMKSQPKLLDIYTCLMVRYVASAAENEAIDLLPSTSYHGASCIMDN
jgi:hypothetical protein